MTEHKGLYVGCNFWNECEVHFHCHLDSELTVRRYPTLAMALADINHVNRDGLLISEHDDDGSIASITVFPPHLLGCHIILEVEK
jgi:hypothetical protein